MSTRVKSLAVIERYLSLCDEQAAAEDDEKLLYELTLYFAVFDISLLIHLAKWPKRE